MGKVCLIACLLLLIAASKGAAQEVKEPLGTRYRYKDVFIPATHTIFLEEFSAYKHGDRPGRKWKEAHGFMSNEEFIDSLNKIRPSFCVWGAIWGLMKPDIPKDVVTGKYVTFECDFALDSTNSIFIIDLPDTNGCKHYFSIGSNWWKQNEPCADTNRVYFSGSFKYNYPVYFDPFQWHCLAVSFTDKEMKFYMDGYNFWGLGNNEEGKGAYQHMYSGRMPATFNIIPAGSRKVIALRSVRFAQSDTAPNSQRMLVAAFNKILTGEKFVTQDIHFEVNKADIKSESLEYLDALVTWLKQNPAIKLEIAGHTDSDGDESANMALSQKRADAIVNKLISSGIATNRLNGIGYGESKPVKPNDTEAEKAANRRVEFRKL